MRLTALAALTLLVAAGCDSTSTPTPTQSQIVIPDTQSSPLATLPEVPFNGNYQTVSDSSSSDGSSDGGGDDGGGGSADGLAESDISSPSVDSAPDRLEGSVAPDELPVVLVPEPIGNEQIQPGTLTAGDYDDQLNPHLYQTYANDFLQRRGQWVDVPRLDFNQRIEIGVNDNAGSAIADARVEVLSDNNTVLSLLTPASGVTSIYSGLDALPEEFELRVSRLDVSAQQTINRDQALAAGEIRVTLVGDIESQANDTAVDLMLVMDTTGSMGDELSYLQTELEAIINSIAADQADIRIGLVFYRDNGDAYVVRSHGFTNDVQTAQRLLNDEFASGGGDYPEAMDQALQAAVAADWRDDSRKVLFLIADAPPHGDRMRATWNAAQQARSNNIHLVPVAASGVAQDAEYIMRSTAALTNGRYLFLTDDSGFGLPHNEPTVDCYVVTSLARSMIRAMNSLLTGRRIEPSADDIIRQLGNYNNGVCEQPPENPDTPQVQYQILLERQVPLNGTFTEQQISTFSDQTALDAALAELGENPIAVDFDTSNVLSINMGQRNTGGYSIQIESITETNSAINARINLIRPGANCLVTEALTNPFVFIAIPSKKTINTTTVAVINDCS